MAISYNLLAHWLQQPLLENDIVINTVRIDSREIEPGDLFVALPGTQFDGHQFIDQAVARGAIAVMAKRADEAMVSTLVVDDVLASLCHVAKCWCEQINPVVIAVTGSCGKTTVKHFIHSILSHVYGDDKVAMSPRNFNSVSGVPLAMLQLKPQHCYAILEMGMNRFGEIEQNSRLAQPDIAAINSIAPVHVEYVGDLNGVARAKGEIFAGLKAQGCAVMNGDLPFVPLWRDLLSAQQRVVTFGEQQGNSVQVSQVVSDFDCCRFQLQIDGQQCEVELPLPGAHQAKNAACAVAISYQLGIPLDQIVAGLCQMQGVNRRMQRLAGQSGAILIDDGYNASPLSVRAAIDVLAEFPGRKVLVLGAMRELGNRELEYHREIGQYAKTSGIDYLLTLGDIAEQAADAFGEGGSWHDSHQAVIAAAQPLLNDNTAVLVKGSLSMNMLVVVNGLVKP